MQTLGLFYSYSKLNRYLRAILQGIHPAVIVVDSNSIKSDARLFQHFHIPD